MQPHDSLPSQIVLYSSTLRCLQQYQVSIRGVKFITGRIEGLDLSLGALEGLDKVIIRGVRFITGALDLLLGALEGLDLHCEHWRG